MARFVLSVLSFFAIANCIFLNYGAFGQIQGSGSSFDTRREGSNFANQGSNFQNSQGGFNTNLNNQLGFGSNSQNPSGGSSNTVQRPTGSDNFSSGSRPTGSNIGSRPSSGSDNSFGRPTGETGSISRPTSGSDSSFNRPTSGSDNFGSRPTSGSDSFNNRPTSGSDSFNNRPTSGSDSFNNRPTSGSDSFNNRPTSESDSFNNRPTSGSDSFNNRPTSGSDSFNNRPTSGSDNFNNRPTSGSDGFNSRPTGSRPDNREGEERPFGGSDSSFSRPTGSNQQTGSFSNQHIGLGTTDSRPGQNEFSSGTDQTGINNEHEKDEKEDDKDVCFGNLGCFKMGKPWKSALRPIGPPHGPERIQTTVFFYSRQNPEKQQNITMHPQINMGQARFDPRKITAIIVHGFSNSGNATWMKDMKNVYLKKVDANVMIVDWGKGAQLLNYLQVAGNTRVVGKELGLFVKYLIQNFGADPGKFHLIGHSLGAQICSYLAKEVPGIARLTALDPAQPGFEGFDKEVRLDKTDAEFVDVIHTDARPFIPALGFGMIAPHGHVDFYMNGGFDQPGCVPPSKKEIPAIKSFLDFAKFPVEVIAKVVACPHARAYEYLIEAFNETENCIFWGHKADAKNVFKSVTNTLTQGLLKKFTALKTTCSKEDCIPVGFATKKSPLRGVFVVTTNGRQPYCISEPGIPPETPPQRRSEDSVTSEPQQERQESFIQKIGKKTGIYS